jgi:hypothetical protein
MKKLIDFIKENYPSVTNNTYLLDRTARIAMIKDEDIVIVQKYVYNSSKGEYIRVNTAPNVYVRVYLDDIYHTPTKIKRKNIFKKNRKEEKK